MGIFPTNILHGCTIHDLAWIEGKWVENVDNEVREEHWSAPVAGTMVGMFRWCAGDDLRFYELIGLEEEDNGVVMRIRHFNRGFDTWEENDNPVTFDLVQSENGSALFLMRGTPEPVWLVYRLTSSSELDVYFSNGDDSEEPKVFFRFSRTSGS